MKFQHIITLILLICSCNERFTPKPTGYLRIDLEQKTDSLFQPSKCPFSFIAPNYFNMQPNPNNNCWLNLNYTKHNATIYLTYKEVENNIFELIEEARGMVYKHTIKADAINEKRYLNNNKETYGVLYDIHGETASSVQFYITDSIQNFIRGALYFEANPNQDSLKPIINYVREDIIRIMESLIWKSETPLKTKTIEI